MQTLIYKGDEVSRIVKAGLISTGMALYTAQDNVKISVYRGSGNIIALKVVIRKAKEDETITDPKSLQEASQGQ